MNKYYHLGLSYFQNKQYDKAIEQFQKALQIDPNLMHAYNYIGNALQEKKNYDEAIAYYQRAIQINPADATAYINMGISLQNKGNFDNAVEYFKKALHLNPMIEPAYDCLGFILTNQGKLEEALQIYRSLLKLNPHSFMALIKMGSILKQKGGLTDSEGYLRAAIEVQPDNMVPWQSLLVGMLYNPRHDAQTIFSEHLKFAKKFTEPLSAHIPIHANERTSERRLHIGYISPDFKKHSVSYFIEPVLRAHEREKCRIFCYSDVQDADDVSVRIEGCADQWRTISGLPDQEVEKLIRSDAIDILVDLAGHTAGNRMLLFARKPAPVQVTWIGYPASTGLSKMDYKIVDRYTDPPGLTERYYTEKLMRLPNCHRCYLPDRESPEVGPLPYLTAGRITFGSFNNFAKVTPEVMELWARILNAVPDSRLLLKANSLSDPETKKYVTNIFLRERLSGERIELLGWEPSSRSHMDTYNRIDIALDTFSYNGTTTTCEALWMGVPVVSLAGAVYASRTGSSLLSNIGLPELVGQTPEEYVNIAVQLTKRIDNLRILRSGLRDMMRRSPLINAGQFTSDLENMYRLMWEKWCTHPDGGS